MWFTGAFVTFSLVCDIVAFAVIAQPTVRIRGTDIVGKHLANSTVDFFGGIPYAKPPLGDLRLKLPVFTPVLDKGIFNASSFGPGCLQTPSPPSGVSEDCLTLTIFRPSRTTSSSKLPVIAWIYGGGFIVGATSFYDASRLVLRSVERGTPRAIIFLSINYRLGPLGFPSGHEAGDQKVLNLGLHDQLTGLQWIKDNIHHFGGDSTKVTIMGESAGATCISLHLQETRISNFVRAAILESPPLVPIFGPGRREGVWENYVAAIPGCASSIASNSTIDCIRKSDSASLLQALITAQVVFQTSAFQPVLDGPDGLVVARPSQINPKARAHLPVLTGSNKDEGTIFIAQDTNSSAGIRALVLAIISPSLDDPAQVNKSIDTLLELYPDVPSVGSPFGTGNETFGLNSQWKRLTAIFGDMLFVSGARILSHRVSASGNDVFAYHFTDAEATAFPEFLPAPVAPGSLGVPHTSEIPYVFGTLTDKSPSALALSAAMQDYWISFATSLNPNDGFGAKRPHWPVYTPHNQVLMQLDGEGTDTVPDNFRKKQLAFWEDNPNLLNT